ncbi:MAG: ABC transporter substrate-binding protein [Isosphaeraceae bacterium]|nr:ABC transporter substrate-binding protein [Isosphaeraceae bacterium]
MARRMFVWSLILFTGQMAGSPGVATAQEPAPAGDLLRSVPFDRITLTDGSVYYIEPVSPRPLPVYDPAKERAKSKEPEMIEITNGDDGPAKAKRKAVAAKAAEETPSELPIHLFEGEVRDFKVKRITIKRIEYFEDLLLAEGDRYVLARDYARAFECFLRVQSRNPNWTGLSAHVNRLLFAEGSAALLDGDGERGLRLLGELHARQPDFPGLADKLAASYGARIDRAFDLGLYRKGRTILHDLGQLAPSHEVVRNQRTRFIAKARSFSEESEKKSGPERLDALAAALRVWPELEGAGSRYADAFRAVPTLDVAVCDLPRTVGPWVRSPADERVTRLLFLPVLTSDDEESTQGPRPGQLAEGLDSADLGRRLVVRLKPGVPWSDRSRPVSAIDVARGLTDRAESTSPLYNARWADLLERVDAPDDQRVEIRLTRPFLKPAAWLLGPIGPAHAGFDGRVATVRQGRQLVGDGLFRWENTTADHDDLRSDSEGSSAATTKIKRIREVPLPSAKAAVGALIRGEVSLVEHVAPDRVAALAANPELKVGRYARPSLHGIALDGRNPALRNRTLRRGLSYAIDRKTLLDETLLRQPASGLNRTSDGPFPRGSYADAPDVKPLGYDPLLAKMLVAAAQKELGGQPIVLTFVYPALPEAQAIVPKLAEAFRLVGLEVSIEERPQSALEEELRAGKRFDLAYRAVRCDDPTMDAGPSICPGYDAPASAGTIGSVASPRILQLLLQLERAPEFPTAKGLALQIDRECRDELPVIPLWQLEDHYAWRTRLKGPAEVADHLYEGIATWEIEPWFARDPWSH